MMLMCKKKHGNRFYYLKNPEYDIHDVKKEDDKFRDKGNSSGNINFFSSLIILQEVI